MPVRMDFAVHAQVDLLLRHIERPARIVRSRACRYNRRHHRAAGSTARCVSSPRLRRLPPIMAANLAMALKTRCQVELRHVLSALRNCPRSGGTLARGMKARYCAASELPFQ